MACGRLCDLNSWVDSFLASELDLTVCRPDHCDGKYDSVCDCDRSGDCSSSNRKCSSVCNKDYSSIEAIMRKFGKLELLDYMNRYWKV